MKIDLGSLAGRDNPHIDPKHWQKVGNTENKHLEHLEYCRGIVVVLNFDHNYQRD